MTIGETRIEEISAAVDSTGMTASRELMWSAELTTSKPDASARWIDATSSVRVGVPLS